MNVDLQRRQALIELLAIPDSFDALRTHRLTLPGKPDRYERVPQLTAVFIQAKLLEFSRNRGENAA